MATTVNSTTAPIEWLESLARSKAQIAAGQTVPLLPILERLRASAEQLDAANNQSPDGAGPTVEE